MTVFSYRDELPRLSIPKNILQRSVDVSESQTTYIGKQMLVLVVTGNQTVVWNTGGQMMDVMIPNVGGKPVQPCWQYKEARALDRSDVAIPALPVGCVGVFEIMLNRKQHYAGRTCK